MPVIDTDNGQMDVISRLLKDRILLLGQGVDDEVANVLVAQLLYLANEDPEKDITLYINSPVRSWFVVTRLLAVVEWFHIFDWIANTNPALIFCMRHFIQGGSVSAGMAIYDTMQYVPCDVSTVWYVISDAAAAAAAVWSATAHILTHTHTLSLARVLSKNSFGMAASMGAFLLGAGAKGKRRALPNSRIMIHQPLGGAQGQAADIEIQVRCLVVGTSPQMPQPTFSFSFLTLLCNRPRKFFLSEKC